MHPKAIYRSWFILCIAAFGALSGCYPTGALEADEILLTQNTISLKKAPELEKPAAYSFDLAAIARPKPNRLFLGVFPLRLWFYTVAGEVEKEKGFKHWLKYTMGEPPAILDTSKVTATTRRFEKYMYDRGFFFNETTAEIEVKNQRAQVNYQVDPMRRWFVRAVNHRIDTATLQFPVVSDSLPSVLQPGQPYSLNRINAERDRITVLLRNNGYYYFGREFVYFFVDTTIGNRGVRIDVRVDPPYDSLATHEQFHVRRVYAYPNYTLDSDSLKQGDTLRTKDLTVIQKKEVVRPVVLDRAILVDEGALFSEREKQYALNHLLELETFKYVNIKYRPIPATDSLDAFLYLTPDRVREIRTQFQTTSRTGNFLGISGSVGFIHRNIFHGAEHFSTSAEAGFETQTGSGAGLVNTLNLNVQTGLKLPRVFPRLPFIGSPGRYYPPTTALGLGFNFQQRVQFFTISTINLNLAYDWQTTPGSSFRYTPFYVDRVRLWSTTAQFDSLLGRNPLLRSSFESVTIHGSKFGYTYNRPEKNRNNLFLDLRADVAGNLLWLLTGAGSSGDRQSLLGQPFSQFIRLESDFRYTFRLSPAQQFATRLYLGGGVPFGNSELLPYVRQFFIGGTTSLRAYRIRTLGPGSFGADERQTKTDFPDQTGDLKLELNAEYRFDIVTPFEGAVFVDAGNIWLLEPDPARPGGVFQLDRFYRQIAIGTGVGLRLDLQFLIFRLDLAVPIREPYDPPGDRWTWSNLTKLDQTVLNIAIGYPF